jgi:hypothetical protein
VITIVVGIVGAARRQHRLSAASDSANHYDAAAAAGAGAAVAAAAAAAATSAVMVGPTQIGRGGQTGISPILDLIDGCPYAVPVSATSEMWSSIFT